MIIEARISEILETAMHEGLTAEQACIGSPELLQEVRRELAACRGLAAVLNNLFPPHVEPAAGKSAVRSSASPHHRPDAAATTVDEQGLPDIPAYRLEGVIGRGGMGVVYRAWDVRLNRPVALKTLKSGAYATHAERTRFLREGRALAALRHPHVVPVYDAGAHAGQPYFTMELVEGGSLAARLAGSPLPATEAAQLLEAVAAAVQAAHDAGIVHRDLKPANVLLGADGTPKVSDFGIVQSGDSIADESVLTLTGQRLGTPSYMAPEQASPRWGAVGPATDVYGVGAILYETLTGRPPFRGDSAAETERQLLTDEPVAPTRLNPRVPRDLETICLKCLVKEQARRYPSASAVADELRRFREGLPIRARRSSLPERLVKWVRRRPTAAIAACLALFIAGAAVAGAVWAASTGAAIARAAVEDLDDVLAHQQQSQWDAADAAIQRASVRLAHVLAPTALRMQLHRARQDQALVRRLDAIHVRGTVPEGMPVTGDLVAEDYALAFRESGIGDAAEPAALAADRIRHSPVCAALVSALDYWATVEKEPTRAWVLRVARLADPDPTGWRDRARDLSASLSPAEATAMLNDPAVDRQPVSAMLLLAGRLNKAGGEARDLVIPLLRKAQQAHPADFWTNIYLGMAHTERGHRAKSHADMDDAARFFQAAVAARPGSDVAYHDLGIVLLNRGTVHSAEAAAAFRESLRLNPKAFVSRAMLGRIASSAGRHAEALAEFDEGLSVEPEDAGLHAARGKSLEALLRDAEAAHAFARALTIDVKSTEAVAGLLRLGRLDAYCDVWRDRLVSAPPSDQFYWDGYPELCLYLERHDDYASVRRQLLERFGASSDVRVLERVGRACLLAPVTGQDLHRATAAIDAALASVPREKAWLKPYFEFGRALADYRAGNFAAAAEVGDRLPSSVLGPCPKMLAAMAYARLGQIATARRALAEGVRQFDWSTTVPEVRDRWMYDVLRREADALVLPDLPAFLAGRYFPASNDERVAMTGACQAAARSVAGASLWAAAFASDPALEPRHRGLAIRAAALAGTGRGTDAASLSPEDQHKWRERARQWLRAELVATTEAPPTTRPSTPPEQRATAARATLAGLLKSPDMAGVRDPSLVVQLPADERPAWTDLWRRITKASADG